MFKYILVLAALLACNTQTNQKEDSQAIYKDPDFESYWYGGKAEITSFSLEQARYGEIHEGTASMIFVTEPFNAKDLVKADRPNSDSYSVMKLNETRKFTTGIYPYSMMNSSFFPVERGEHVSKISSSSQEWCGHTYMTLEHKKKYDISIDSYFEGESKQLRLDVQYTEDDIWHLLRIAPEKLPTGNISIIPSFFFLRLKHIETKAYNAIASLREEGNQLIYSIEYPSLKRSLRITCQSSFPRIIEGWEESYISGFGNANPLTTKAKRIETMQLDYWNLNRNQDSVYRKKLGLE